MTAAADALDHAAVLAEAANFYYEANALYEDEDLEPDDHLGVVIRNFTAGDCDAFAAVVAEMTGWSTVRATWTVGGDFGHHALVKAPDGRMFDAAGFTDEAALRKRYGARSLKVAEGKPLSPSQLDDPEELRRVANVVRALPHAPFGDGAFRALSTARLEGEALEEGSPGEIPRGP